MSRHYKLLSQILSPIFQNGCSLKELALESGHEEIITLILGVEPSMVVHMELSLHALSLHLKSGVECNFGEAAQTGINFFFEQLLT